jgi:hypothetical protein
MAKNGSAGIAALILATLGLVLALGGSSCVDPPGEDGGGRVGGTSLYVFDSANGATNRILVYSDIAVLFNNPDVKPSRELRGSLIDSVRNLAWGGMCFDSNRNRLYLVSESGDVVRINRARSQNGNITSQLEIVSFRLGESDGQHLSGGKFGQAAIDHGSGDLYVTESNSSRSRIWLITRPGDIANGASVSDSNILPYIGDRGGASVAIGTGGSVYAYFQDGVNLPMPTGITYSGPRLRKGGSSGFDLYASLIIGDASESTNKTKMGRYGSLAADNSGNVFFAKHLYDAGDLSGQALLVFRHGQFNPGMSQAPETSFSNISNLRVLSHAFTKDWLVGATSHPNTEDGAGTVWIWRVPTLGAAAASKELNLGSSMSIRGLALDGSN